MLTRNIKFVNFDKKYSRGNFGAIKKFKKINFIKEYKLLISLSKKYKYSYSFKDIKKFKKKSIFRLIGMGGSILGSEAIYQFLQHRINKKFIFINNLKSNLSNYEKSKKMTNIIISKSGNTLETILNFNNISKDNKNKNIFITEKKNTYLFDLANKLKDEVFEHKNYIGGRYSVLSEVGMLPAELMGLKVKKFKNLNYLLRNKTFLNNLILNVQSTIKLIKEGRCNSIILNYDDRSENLFRWYQQLIAESLGKKSKGILPVISSMPRDNHSLLQLYLDGPKINFFTFFNVLDKKSKKINKKYFKKDFSFLGEKSFFDVINSQKIATQNIFKRKKIPFRSFQVINRNEQSLGELFTFFILETILLGRALKVNPFDQPSVDLIKIETKKILS